ncbi:glycosyltransferase family 9 protein [Chitinibacter sp. S2-10]|uniref:glycosyltransferase family 9 protein n=1 Tax=Chitinibacter sp. S2-10 TaxID=3373597 RepID=UPI00397733D9
MLPAVQSLCEALPNTEITWIIERKFLPVVQHLAQRITLYPVDDPRTIADFIKIKRDFAHQHFDILFAMQAKLRSNLIYPLIKANRKIGFDKLRAKDGQRLFTNESVPFVEQHLADGFLGFLSYIGIEHRAKNWAPTLLASALAWREQVVGKTPYLVFNSASSKVERDWPLERQAEFLARLPETGWQGTVIITGADPVHGAQLAARAPNGINLSGQTDLPQLFALLAGASLLISPDSGPVHIARAYDVPVLGLYAVVRSELTGPWQRNQFCVDVYEDAVRQLQQRDPAKLNWHHRVHSPEAMKLISVDVVLAQTAKVIEEVLQHAA